ncbi:hypothetical protein XHV734_0528 [Xanthomonas hortorum pv. vitians]|nr:hypothetical protein XHV734_0528 [Xanthomonas hortorum pv. vitians]
MTAAANDPPVTAGRLRVPICTMAPPFRALRHGGCVPDEARFVIPMLRASSGGRHC